MKSETIIAAFAGLLVGVILAGFTAGQVVNHGNTSMMRIMGMDTSKINQPAQQPTGTMSSMQLQSLIGDKFDQSFLDMMIAHNQAAITMARLAPARAQRAEIRKFSEDLTAAKNEEVAKLQQWQKDWGYSHEGVQ